MIHLFLKLRVQFILACKLAKARQERRRNIQRLKAFKHDQAQVNARMTGLIALEYRANLIELRRLNTKYQIHLEVLQDGLKNCPTNELRELLEVMTRPRTVTA
jgi:hypothetical protein